MVGPSGVEWLVRVVAGDGTKYGTITRARITSCRWELNGLGSATFSVHPMDPELGLLMLTLVDREIQIWRNGVCVWWGVPVTASITYDSVTIGCLGAAWYYVRRFLGPNITEELLNGDFEAGLANWTYSGSGTATSTTSATPVLEGSLAARLVSPDAGLNNYLTQAITTVHGGSPGSILRHNISGWVNLASDWIGPAFDERGLFVWTEYPAATVFHQNWDPITERTPRGVWQQLVTDIQIPTGVTSTSYVRLYSPGGTAYWDNIRWRFGTFVGSDSPVDVATLITNLVNYAGAKSPINMLVSAAATGNIQARMYLEEEHGNIWDFLMEYPARAICDVEVVPAADGNTRTLTTFAPAKGTYKPTYRLEWGRSGGSIERDWRWVIDASGLTTSARVLGPGQGVAREQAVSTDASDVGGLVLESVDTAGVDVGVGALKQVSERILGQRRVPRRLPTTTVTDGERWIGNVTTGDTVPCAFDRGWLQVPLEIHRIATMEIDPTSGLLSVGVEP